MSIDMSAKAVTARIKRVSQLRRLCLSLGTAKPVKDEDHQRQRTFDGGNSNEFVKEIKAEREQEE